MDLDLADRALAPGDLALPPAVLTEVLSDSRAPPLLKAQLAQCAILEVTEGYWARAGALRAILHKHKLKAGTADARIAQSRIDHGVALMTRDDDFRHFAKYGDLKLA